MCITIDFDEKRVCVDYVTSINFTEIDFNKYIFFIWNNDILISSVIIPDKNITKRNCNVDITYNKKSYSFVDYIDFLNWYIKDLVK